MNLPNPEHSHKFNPFGPVGYLLTFRTYGTWLHGDYRGSVDRKTHNIPGIPFIEPDPAIVKQEREMLKQPPVTFNIRQRKSVDSTVRQVSAYRKWILHAVNVRTEHVHIVVTALKSPESVMNSFKTWCTRRMRENGLWNSEYSPWSRHGSTRYLWNEKDIHNACVYVLYGQGDLFPP